MPRPRAPGPSMIPASSIRGPDALSRSHRVADRGNELELVADVADRRDAGRQVNRPPFDLLEMGVHIPQARHDGLARRPHHGRLPAAPRRDSTGRRPDAAVHHHDRTVQDWFSAGHVEDRRADNRQLAAGLRGLRRRGIGHRRHAVDRRACDELGNQVPELRPRGLEVVELGIHGDQCGKAACRIAPHRFTAPDDAADAVAVEDDGSAVNHHLVAGRAARYEPCHAEAAPPTPGRPCAAQYSHQRHLHRRRCIASEREDAGRRRLAA